MATAAVFRRNLTARIDAALSTAARSARLAALAKKELADLRASGRVPDGAATRRYVDGKEGAPEESVRGDGRGVILYEFSYTAEAAAFGLAYLLRRTARMPKYRSEFFVGVNGRPIPATAFNPAKVPAGAEIVIINKAPYNRLADVQYAGKRRVVFPIPADLYNDAAAAVNRRFGNSIKAKRVYDMGFPGKYMLKRTTRRRSAGQPVQSPALIINDRG